MDCLFNLSGGIPVRWQLDGEFRSAVRPVGGVNLAAEILDDPIGNGEPKPESFTRRLGGEERIEDAVDLVRGNTIAVVGNGDGDSVRKCAYANPDPGIVLVHDGIERIADKIEDDLLELDGVAVDHEVGRNVLLDAYAGGSDLASEQNQRALDRAIDGDRLRMTGLTLAREGLEMAGDARHALGKV